MFYKPKSMEELLDLLNEKNEKVLFLAGGTDINVLIKKGVIKDSDTIFFINHFDELKVIQEKGSDISIGALTNYQSILSSELVKKYFPLLQTSLEHFASPLIQSMATIGGNIANGSPTNDVSPLLLVLDAKLVLVSKQGKREVFLKDFYIGYKKNILKNNEIITEIRISKDAQKDFITYYDKVASRNILAISKLSLAGLKKMKNDLISEIKLAVGSLNEYPRRLFRLEEYIKDKSLHTLDFSKIRELLSKEITPISDFRSDKEYRFEVCQNLITDFLSKK